MPQLARRGAWHREHPGLVPLTGGLQIARTTATLAAVERAAAARRACAYLGAIAALESPLPGDAAALWRHCAYLADDPAAALACAELDRAALDRAPFLVPRVLDALARAGRFADLARTAVARGATALGCWLLARGGRPFLALALRRLARADDLHALAGQTLALFAAGRPDLAQRTLGLALPIASGPGDVEREARDQGHLPGAGESRRPDARTMAAADQQWRAARDPLMRAWLSGDLAQLVGLAVPASAAADPDVVDLSLVAALERALSADLAGATVYLAGAFPDRARTRAAIEGRGGLVVSGPFGKVDYVLVGDGVDPGELARLTSLGATPLSPDHLRL
jgi:hypothetical protein